jgi:hypothetical protein
VRRKFKPAGDLTLAAGVFKELAHYVYPQRKAEEEADRWGVEKVAVGGREVLQLRRYILNLKVTSSRWMLTHLAFF